MNREKIISTLQQIKTLAADALMNIDAKGSAARRPKAPSSKTEVSPREVSFNMNVLAFMKKHAAGLSGPKKFTLLLAWITKGITSQEVSSADIEKQWNKMKGVLGGRFNGAYANRAKANGWVDSPRFRTYTVSDSWKESILEK